MQGTYASNKVIGTVFIFTGCIFDKTKVIDFISNVAMPAVSVFIDTDMDNDIPGVKLSVQDSLQKKEFAAAVKDYDSAYIVTPSLGLLHSLALGETTSFASELILRALLWEKKVTTLLDFKPCKFKRNTAFQKLSEDLEALIAMGMVFETFEDTEENIQKELQLITEEEVKQAAAKKQKVIMLKPGGVVTPLARDAAKENNIIIVNIKE